MTAIDDDALRALFKSRFDKFDQEEHGLIRWLDDEGLPYWSWLIFHPINPAPEFKSVAANFLLKKHTLKRALIEVDGLLLSSGLGVQGEAELCRRWHGFAYLLHHAGRDGLAAEKIVERNKREKTIRQEIFEKTIAMAALIQELENYTGSDEQLPPSKLVYPGLLRDAADIHNKTYVQDFLRTQEIRDFIAKMNGPEAMPSNPTRDPSCYYTESIEEQLLPLLNDDWNEHPMPSFDSLLLAYGRMVVSSCDDVRRFSSKRSAGDFLRLFADELRYWIGCGSLPEELFKLSSRSFREFTEALYPYGDKKPSNYIDKDWGFFTRDTRKKNGS